MTKISIFNVVFLIFTTTTYALPRLQGTELGFDSLRQISKGRLFVNEYDNLTMTPDLKFQVPINSVPTMIHSNMMTVNSKIDYHWQNTSSYVFSSLSVSAHASYLGIGASGSYTQQNTDFRSSQQTEKTAMITTTYSAKLYRIQNDIYSTKLSGNAYSEIQFMLVEMQKANHAMAKYMMENFLSAYGDTVLTSVVYGGSMMTYSIVTQNWLQTVSEQTTMKAGSAGFSAFFGGISGSYLRNTDDKDLTGMMQNSRIFDGKTHGGRVRNNLTIETFVNSLFDDGEVVPIDATGINICEIFSPKHLPNNTFTEILALKSLCNKVRDLYFDVNLPLGCTRQDAPNFNPKAMRDDGSCKQPKNNYSFFGMYQTCQAVSEVDSCASFQQMNPKTNAYSCTNNDHEKQYLDDVIVSTTQQISQIPIAQFCGGMGADQFDCVYHNLQIVTAESNEVFIDTFMKCTGGKTYPSLPAAGCGQSCHRVWFHHDCRNDCSAGIWYNFGVCDDTNSWAKFWCQANIPYIQCYNQAQDTARNYFYANVYYKKVGHVINVHTCVPKVNQTEMNKAGIIGYNILGFYTNTIPNPVAKTPQCPVGSTTLNLFSSPASSDFLRLCIADDNMTPYQIPFGGIATCQHDNPYITPNRLDCSPGYSRYYVTFNGLCETLICLDMSRVETLFEKPVIRDLPFMEMPNPMISIHNYVQDTSKSIHSYLTYMIHNNMFNKANITHRIIPIVNETAMDIIIPATPSTPLPTVAPSVAPSVTPSTVPPSAAPSVTPSTVPSQTDTENNKSKGDRIAVGFAVLSLFVIVVVIVLWAFYQKRKNQLKNDRNVYVTMNK